MNCIARSSGTLTMLFSSKYCSLVTAVQEHIHLVVLKKKKYIVYINMSYDTLKKHGLSAHKYRTPHGARVSIQIRMPYQNIPHFQLTILVIWSLWIFWTRTSNDQTTIQLELFYIYILSCSMKWKCVQSIHIAIYISIALPNPQSTTAVSKFPAYVGCISLIHSIVRNSHAICRRWVNNKSIWLNYIGMRQLHKWQICYPPYKSCCILSIGSYAIPLVRVRGVRTHLPCNLINSQRKHKTIPCLFEC